MEVVTVVGDAAIQAVPLFSLDRVVAVEKAQCLPVCRALEHWHALGLQVLAVLIGLVRAAQHRPQVLSHHSAGRPLGSQVSRDAKLTSENGRSSPS